MWSVAQLFPVRARGAEALQVPAGAQAYASTRLAVFAPIQPLTTKGKYQVIRRHEEFVILSARRSVYNRMVPVPACANPVNRRFQTMDANTIADPGICR